MKTYFLLLIFPMLLQAQTLQVVTKSVAYSFEFSGKEKVQIYAERSDIEIITWQKQEIKITIDLSAKHPDRTTAEKDLKALQHIVQKSGRNIVARNFIALTANAPKPQANLKAKYIVYAPPTCGIEIRNTFGIVVGKNLQNGIYLQADFCQTALSEIKGKVDLFTYFGSLKINDIEGKSTIKAERTDLLIRAPKGELSLVAQYGSLDMEADKTAVKLKIDTKNTEMRGATLANKPIR